MTNEMNPNGIICAINVNDFDQDVVDLAATFAQQAHTDLDIVHVTLFPDPVHSSWPSYRVSPYALLDNDRLLQKVTTTVSGVPIHRHHLSGLPGEKILEFAGKNQPRLLVVGTHGRKGLARIFGSVAAKILRHARCPVMVVRQRQGARKFADRMEAV
jgi:nucleotide-binding universal stress UspA family protein